MRILVATHQWFPDYAGGSARVATDTARWLAERGHDVVVLAPVSEGSPPEEREGRMTVWRVLPRSLLPQTLTDTVFTLQQARRLPRQRFDVLLAHHPTVAVGLLGARLEAPLAFVYHASSVRELRLERASLGFRARRLATYALAPLLVALERATVRRAALSLVLSNYSASLLEADHRDAMPQIRITPGGVDPRAFAPTDDREALRRQLGVASGTSLILTARRLDPCLGLETLIAAVSRLAASHSAVLAIAGRGSLESALRRLVTRLGIEGRVRFLGTPAAADLRNWYAAADLFVTSPAPHEGFGMVTLEALASGTPVVGSPLGATPELLRPLDTRLIAAEASAEALAAALDRALGVIDSPFRHRCREYAVKGYAWDRSIRSWENALEEAAGQVPRQAERTKQGGSPLNRTSLSADREPSVYAPD
jgi:glycosyltransferase involved in cell wall biosynthesis